MAVNTFTLTANPASVAQGGSTTLTADISGVTTGVAGATLTVTVTAIDTGLSFAPGTFPMEIPLDGEIDGSNAYTVGFNVTLSVDGATALGSQSVTLFADESSTSGNLSASETITVTSSGDTGGWVSYAPDPTTGTIQTNRVELSAAGVVVANEAPASAEYDVEADMRFAFTGGSAGGRGVAGRIDTASDTYYAAIINSTNVELWKSVNGTATKLDDAGFVPVSVALYALKLEIRDAAKKVYIDGLEMMSSTDNSITAAGYAGAYSAHALVSNALALDSFTATNVGDGEGDPYEPPAPPSGPPAPDPDAPYSTFPRTIIPYSGSRPTLTGGTTQTASRLYRSSKGNVRGDELTSVASDGTITIDRNRAINGTIRLDTNAPDAIPAWSWVAVHMDVTRESQEPETRQVGLFRMGQPESTGKAAWSPTTVPGDDVTVLMHNYRYSEAVTFGTSLDGRTLLQGLCYADGNGTTRTRIPLTDKTMGFTRSWKAGTTAWAIADEVRKAMGWYPLTADDEGFIVTQEIKPLAEVEPVRTYQLGRDARVLGDIRITRNDDAFANEIVLTSQRPGRPTIIAVATNVNPNDPNSTVHPNGPGTVTAHVTDNTIDDQLVADIIAQLLLLQRGVLAEISLILAPDLSINIYDVIALDATVLPHMAYASGKWQVTAKMYDLRSGVLTVKARRNSTDG